MTLRIAPPQDDGDRAWLGALWREEWGGDVMVTRGTVHTLAELDALVAWSGDERVGLATCLITGASCELMSLNATTEGQGAGTALLAAVEEEARRRECKRVWLITSNDNLDALRFYQRRGYACRPSTRAPSTWRAGLSLLSRCRGTMAFPFGTRWSWRSTSNGAGHVVSNMPSSVSNLSSSVSDLSPTSHHQCPTCHQQVTISFRPVANKSPSVSNLSPPSPRQFPKCHQQVTVRL